MPDCTRCVRAADSTVVGFAAPVAAALVAESLLKLGPVVGDDGDGVVVKMPYFLPENRFCSLSVLQHDD